MTSKEFYDTLEKGFDSYNDYLQNKLTVQSIKDSNIWKFLKNNPTFYLESIKDSISGKTVPGMIVPNIYIRQEDISIKIYFERLKKNHPVLYRVRKVTYRLIGIRI